MPPPNALTEPDRFFLEPQEPRQRQYEALRAYFVDGMPSALAARQYGYTPGAFRVLCHAFRHGRRGEFFAHAPRGRRCRPRRTPPGP